MTLLKDNNYKDINVALLSLEADIKNKITGFDTSVIDKQLAEINSRIDKINVGGGNNSSEEIEDINSKLNSNSIKIRNIEQNIEDIGTQINGIEQKLSDIFSAENKVTDFNTTTTSGIYYWVTDAANRPTDYGVLLVNKYDGGDVSNLWINQIAYGTNGKIYFRQNINSGSWTEWKAVAFEGEIASNRYYFRAHHVYRCLGTATLRQDGDYLLIRVFSGNGYNALLSQDISYEIHLRTSNGKATSSGLYYAGYVEYHLNGSSSNLVYVVQNSAYSFTIWIGLTNYTGNSFYTVENPDGSSWSSSTETSTSLPSGATQLTAKQIAYNTENVTFNTAKASNKMVIPIGAPSSLEDGCIWIS